MYDKVAKGRTNYIAEIFIQDSSSTTGAGLTGLTSGSSGLVCYRARPDDGNAGGTAISLSGGTRGTWSSGGFVEKDSTNMAGWYELGVPNAALASGADKCAVHLKGATNMAPCPILFQLTDTNDQDAVHGGMSALPNTACTTNASLLTSGTGADQLSVASGRVDIGKVVGNTQTADGNGLLKVDVEDFGGTAGTFAGGRAEVNVTKWLGGTIPAVNVTGVPLVDLKYTLGTISAGAAGYVGIDWAAVQNPTSSVTLSATTVGTLTTYTGNTPQTGDSYARIGATGSGLTSLAPASTALSTVQWTNTRASNLDNLDAAVSGRLATFTVDGKTPAAALQIVAAAVVGLCSGAGTGTETYKGLDQSTARLVVSIDVNGNRTSVTYS
jgi:hypothetical protein